MKPRASLATLAQLGPGLKEPRAFTLGTKASAGNLAWWVLFLGFWACLPAVLTLLLSKVNVFWEWALWALPFAMSMLVTPVVAVIDLALALVWFARPRPGGWHVAFGILGSFLGLVLSAFAWTAWATWEWD